MLNDKKILIRDITISRVPFYKHGWTFEVCMDTLLHTQ